MVNNVEANFCFSHKKKKKTDGFTVSFTSKNDDLASFHEKIVFKKKWGP